MKEKNPDVKLLAGIGGLNEGSAVFSKVAANFALRSKFISAVSIFLDSHGFDGVDIDWEYPAQKVGSSPADKENFVTLLRELSNVLNAKDKILSVAVAAVESSASISYDIENVAKYVEFVLLMSYNLLTPVNSKTGKKSLQQDLILN